jgi:hypothetical protein
LSQVAVLTDRLYRTALDTDDLFTRPPDPVLVAQVERGELDFELVTDPHAVAGLILTFLQKLPSMCWLAVHVKWLLDCHSNLFAIVPVLTFELHDCFLGVGGMAV